jgi:hypothetical protein
MQCKTTVARSPLFHCVYPFFCLALMYATESASYFSLNALYSMDLSLASYAKRAAASYGMDISGASALAAGAGAGAALAAGAGAGDDDCSASRSFLPLLMLNVAAAKAAATTPTTGSTGISKPSFGAGTATASGADGGAAASGVDGGAAASGAEARAGAANNLSSNDSNDMRATKLGLCSS